jgi:protein-S-isoprenylcysteine O-methyltransferase Ste14
MVERARRGARRPGLVTLLRHLVSILLLPVVVTIVVPRWLLTSWAHADSRWPVGSTLEGVGRALGLVLLIAGLALFAWCVALFARVGRGTLAPWDPTRRLVAVGPYRHVRNPMITGVATILAAESLLLGSRLLAAWLGAFVVINHLYFVLSEEPGLARRFGASYEEYRASVPRWLPRARPWGGAG